MKTDYGIKYFFAEIDGTDMIVAFRTSPLKGVHDVDIRVMDKGKHNIKIKGTYPGCFGKLAEAFLFVPVIGKHLYRQLYRLDNYIAKSSAYYTD